SSPSSLAVRWRAPFVEVREGTNATPSPAASAATGQRVTASIASPTTTPSRIFLRPDSVSPALMIAGRGGVPGGGALRVSSAMSTTSPTATRPPASAASKVIGSPPIAGLAVKPRATALSAARLRSVQIEQVRVESGGFELAQHGR